jgi:beta-glucosidase/6-phospho-beta-glucosidase/beta-galactosidase
MSLEQIVDDKDRQEYLNLYIKALCDASKEDGVLVTGFYTWSLLE